MGIGRAGLFAIPTTSASLSTTKPAGVPYIADRVWAWLDMVREG